MQKNVALALGITVALYVVWFMWFLPKPAPVPPGGPATAPGAPSTQGGQVAPAPSAPAGTRATDDRYPAAPDETIGNGRLEVTFASAGGAVRSADAFGCTYHAPGDRSVAGDPGRCAAWADGMAGALAVDLVGGDEAIPNLAMSNWKLVRDGRRLTAEFDHGDWVLTKTFELSADPAAPWHGTFDVALRNVSAAPGRALTLEVVGPLEPRPVAGEHDHGLLLADGATVEHLSTSAAPKALQENPRFERRSVNGGWSWIGARGDFYLSALIPSAPLPADATVGYRTGKRPDLHDGTPTPVSAATLRLPLTVPEAGASATYSFTYFAGPNQRQMLIDPASPYHVLEGARITRSFLGLELTWIATLMGWLLGRLASTGMGYGLAVLTLTVLVRGALFPLSRKSQISMRLHSQKMQRLKPKMDALKEKYKDSKKQQEMTMKLMREEKVSLLPGGCLLAFAQMPIWIALYGVLQSTFEMRHASFLWVADLTAPDRLAHLPFLAGVAFLPEWLNLLPILMMATWYASAAMQPLPDDPQQAQTAKMMRWMPVLMGVFLWSSAAGLTLYMTMSALWSIGETWLIRKVWLTKLEAAIK